MRPDPSLVDAYGSVEILHRRDEANSVLAELHKTYKEMIPFLKSNQIEQHLNSLDQCWAGYISVIRDFHLNTSTMAFFQRSGAGIPQDVLDERVQLVRSLYDEREFKRIDVTLTEVETILAEYHRTNV